MAAVGGLDCHARHVPIASIDVFPYEKMFRLLRNHLFVARDHWQRDPVAALTEALGEGRGFIAHDIIADATGTRAWARLPSGERLELGQEGPFQTGTTTEITLPHCARIRWWANGRERLAVDADHLTATPAGPGVYRFEAWLDGVPWIFTNAFYLR
jgi:hypothetical protein